MISYEDFKKIELKAAKILAAERIEGSDKLLKLQIDLGEEKRQLVAGIGKVYKPESLIGREIIVVANLEPRTFTLRSDSEHVGHESNGMLLAADDEAGPILLMPEKEVRPGTEVR